MSTIKLNNLTKIVQGKYILNNVNYVFEESKIYVIYGKNGEGIDAIKIYFGTNKDFKWKSCY